MCHLSHDAPVLRKIHPFAIRPSPTHFLSLQTAGLAPAIEKVQAALVAHTPALAPALVDAATMHLTLMVMRLENKDSLSMAVECLEALPAALEAQGLLGAVHLQAQGLSHFRHQVLYLDLRRDEGYETLVSLAGAARQHFAEAGCPAMDADRAFTPHVTIAKLSKLSVGKRWRNDQVCKKIPQEAYAGFVDFDGGAAVVDELQLCAMQGRKEGCYYPVESSVDLTARHAIAGHAGRPVSE